MGRLIGRLLFLVNCFLLPAAAYSLLWWATSKSTLNGLGFALWLRFSNEDLLNVERFSLLALCFQFGVPPLLGLTGLLWGRWWLRRRDRDAGAAAN